jgi:hypothetical protein
LQGFLTYREEDRLHFYPAGINKMKCASTRAPLGQAHRHGCVVLPFCRAFFFALYDRASYDSLVAHISFPYVSSIHFKRQEQNFSGCKNFALFEAGLR